jgi:hypothetical protein
MRTERQEFRADRNLLYSTICSQAGTLEKALCELVMNSIDAEATRVDVELTNQTFKVVDDGRGFSSRDEIDRFFNTFGTPHQEGDAVYGRFRMGRGQIMAFTKNTWRSGPFQMDVDIKEHGLAYDLTTLGDVLKGCQIEGTMYEPLSAGQVIQTADSLAEMVRYMPIPVYINGELMAVGCGNLKWTEITEDAYFQLKATDYSLSVYNLGALVQSYPAHRFGIGGVVVSRKQLNVNFARNDIMASCPIWKAIQKAVRQHSGLGVQQRKKPWTDSRRARVLRALVTNDFQSKEEVEEAILAPVFTDVTGRHHDLRKLIEKVSRSRGMPLTVATPTVLSVRAHEADLAFVLSDVVEARGARDLRSIFDRIRTSLHLWDVSYNGRGRFGPFNCETVWKAKERIVDFDKIDMPHATSFEPIKDSKLSKEERIVLNSIRHGEWIISARMGLPRRRIDACESDTLDGATDGKTVIWINRTFLKVYGWNGGATQAFGEILSLLVHEYCHDADDSSAHGHPPEFYERFHNVMGATGKQSIMPALNDMTTRYLWLRKNAGLKMRSGDLKALDIALSSVEEEYDIEEDALAAVARMS